MFGRLKDPVDAIAQVVAISGEGRTREVTLSLQVPGQPARTAQTSERFADDRVPVPSTVLPARVDQADPDHFEVDWDQVPVGSAGTDGPAAIPTEAQAVVGQLQQLFPGAQIHVETATIGDPGAAAEVLGGLERAVGQDLDGDGVVRGSVGGGDDRLGQLERLARLRASGDLTEQEFAAEKHRLLGGG